MTNAPVPKLSATADMNKRPKYLNLVKIRLPLPGVLSILHRISGIVLIGALPFALAALQYSVSSAAGYAQVAGLFGAGGYWFCKLAAAGRQSNKRGSGNM